MICDNCKSNLVADVLAKCSDMCHFELNDTILDGYVPNNVHIGGGDYVEFEYCLDCGKIQGNFPVKDKKQWK